MSDINTAALIYECYEHMTAAYPDALILMGVPGAYIAIKEDAALTARLLSLPLRPANEKIPMEHVVFPTHGLQLYLPRLTRYAKVAVIEQIQPDEKATPQLSLF